MAQLFVELLAHETVCRDVHDDGAQRRDQVKLTFVAQPVDEVQTFLDHDSHILLHRRGLETRHDYRALAQIFIHLGKAVEIRREHLEEKGHRFPNGKQLVGFLEEKAVMLRPEHDVHPAAHDTE